MLYEVHDPANYITPDVVVDFTTARLEQVGPDRVRVTDIGGKPRTPTLKVSIGCTEGFIGEDMFFYAGPGALRRAQLAKRDPRGALQDRRPRGRGGPHRLPRPERHPRRGDAGGRAGALRDRGARRRPHPDARGGDRRSAARSTAWRSPASRMTGKRVPHQDRTREVIGVWSSLVPREAVPRRIDDASRADADAGHAAARRPRPLRRQGQHLQHRRDRLQPRALSAAEGAAHRRALQGASTAARSRARSCATRSTTSARSTSSAHGALGGGVSRSLCLDNYGKALSAAILGFELDVPERLGNHLRGMEGGDGTGGG